MFSFFKKKTGTTNVPEWAEFFDAKEYEEFIKRVDEYFRKLNVKYDIAPGQILLDGENEFDCSSLGLVNVAQVCKQNGPGHYKAIIKEHFNRMIQSARFQKKFDEIADNFEQVKDYIGVRLYDKEYTDLLTEENRIGKHISGDVSALVVFDFPDSVVNVKPEQTTAWNKTKEELFEIGLENIRAKYPFEITKEPFGEFRIWFVQGNHFFVPNIIFDLEHKKELIGSKGALIGLPHRHAAIIYPIENLEVLKAINGLIPAIHGMFIEGPGSLSNNLFWYKDNTFTHLPYKIDDKKLQFFPPDEFVDLLNELGE
jgi:hypothetical protein